MTTSPSLRVLRRPSKQAQDLVRRWEGCRLHSYEDQNGKWTIGWGSTGPAIGPGLTITQQEADAMLLNTLDRFGTVINSLVKVPLTQNQFDALCSLVYNIGPGAFQHSQLLTYLNNKQYSEARSEILKWDHVLGVVDKGLALRRWDEFKVFGS